MADYHEEAARRFKEKAQKGRFKLVEGDNTLRILPRIGAKNSNAPFFEYPRTPRSRPEETLSALRP